MPYLDDDFLCYYNDKILPLQLQNNQIRKKYLLMFAALCFLVVCFYPFVLWKIIESSSQNSLNEKILGMLLSASGFLIMLLSAPIYLYKKKAKSNGIMQELASFFGGFEYEFEKPISSEVLAQSLLFGNFNKTKSGDCFLGKYKDTKINIFEIKLENHTFNGKKKHKQKVFRGVCISLDMSKKFVGQTIVLKDRGILNILNRHGNLQRVSLESVDFEKKFEVYADDQIEARYLLDVALMERMLKLNELYFGKSVQFSFLNHQVLIAIETKKDTFEVCSFFKNNINYDLALNTYNQFKTIFSLIDTLNLK